MKQTGRALWLLCKVQFLGLFDYNRIRKSGDRKKERRFSLMVGLMVLIGLLCAGISTFYSYLFGFLFLQIGKIQLLPVLMMAVTSLVVLCTTVYKAPTTLFSFQDYDLVMSLPVRQPVVIASRMLLLYGMNLGFTLVLMLPAGILYGIFAAIPVSYWFLFGFSLFLIPLVPVTAASVLGAGVAALSSRFRHMKAVQLGLLFVLLMGLMVVSVGVEMVEPQQLGEIGLALLAWVESLYPPAALYRLGVCQGEWLSFLLFSLGSLLVFLLFCWGVGKCFGWLHTALTTYSRRKSYRIGKIESQKPFHALYCKEWKRYLSSPVYVLNTAFGMVLLTVGAVALLFFPKGTFEAVMASQGMGGASISISNLAAFLICFLVSTVCTSASSISLEGKQLWLIKSLPVTARMIFRAKLAVNFTLFIPLIPDCVLLWYLLSLDLFSLAKILFLSVVFAVFTALFGLLANLKFPNFTWKTETAVVKQSFAVFATILCGMIFALLPFILSLFLSTQTGEILCWGVGVILLCLSGVMWAYLLRNDERLLKSLSS